MLSDHGLHQRQPETVADLAAVCVQPYKVLHGFSAQIFRNAGAAVRYGDDSLLTVGPAAEIDLPTRGLYRSVVTKVS